MLLKLPPPPQPPQNRDPPTAPGGPQPARPAAPPATAPGGAPPPVVPQSVASVGNSPYPTGGMPQPGIGFAGISNYMNYKTLLIYVVVRH